MGQHFEIGIGLNAGRKHLCLLPALHEQNTHVKPRSFRETSAIPTRIIFIPIMAFRARKCGGER
jgi:hypothetical protein